MKFWYKKSFSLSSFLLTPLSWLYQWRAERKYSKDLRSTQETGSRAYQLYTPVIVVGNLTVGGTGKTPTVRFLLRFLHAMGFKVAVISRGYGGNYQGCHVLQAGDSPTLVGDEMAMQFAYCLRQNLTDIKFIVCRDRFEAAMKAQELGVNFIIADDGLQHYKLPRNLEILVLGPQGLGNGKFLPAGPLRETPLRLKKVDFIINNMLPTADNQAQYYYKLGYRSEQEVLGFNLVSNLRNAQAALSLAQIEANWQYLLSASQSQLDSNLAVRTEVKDFAQTLSEEEKQFLSEHLLPLQQAKLVTMNNPEANPMFWELAVATSLAPQANQVVVTSSPQANRTGSALLTDSTSVKDSLSGANAEVRSAVSLDTAIDLASYQAGSSSQGESGQQVSSQYYQLNQSASSAESLTASVTEADSELGVLADVSRDPLADLEQSALNLELDQQKLEAVLSFIDRQLDPKALSYKQLSLKSKAYLTSTQVLVSQFKQAFPKVVAICAIGYAEGFRDSLSKLGLEVVELYDFKDHHQFAQADLDQIYEQHPEYAQYPLVVTEKDAIKLEGLNLPSLTFYVEREARFVEHPRWLEQLKDRIISLYTSYHQ